MQTARRHQPPHRNRRVRSRQRAPRGDPLGQADGVQHAAQASRRPRFEALTEAEHRRSVPALDRGQERALRRCDRPAPAPPPTPPGCARRPRVTVEDAPCLARRRPPRVDDTRAGELSVRADVFADEDRRRRHDVEFVGDPRREVEILERPEAGVEQMGSGDAAGEDEARAHRRLVPGVEEIDRAARPARCAGPAARRRVSSTSKPHRLSPARPCRRERVDLAGEFGGMPLVVGVEKSDERAVGERGADVARRRRPCGRLVAMEHESRIVERGADDGAGRFGRAVVDDDHLDLAHGLREGAGDRPCAPRGCDPWSGRRRRREVGRPCLGHRSPDVLVDPDQSAGRLRRIEPFDRPFPQRVRQRRRSRPRTAP